MVVERAVDLRPDVVAAAKACANRHVAEMIEAEVRRHGTNCTHMELPVKQWQRQWGLVTPGDACLICQSSLP